MNVLLYFGKGGWEISLELPFMSCGTLDWLDKGVSLWTLDIIVWKSMERMDSETFGMIWISPKIIKAP